MARVHRSQEISLFGTLISWTSSSMKLLNIALEYHNRWSTITLCNVLLKVNGILYALSQSNQKFVCYCRYILGLHPETPLKGAHQGVAHKGKEVCPRFAGKCKQKIRYVHTYSNGNPVGEPQTLMIVNLQVEIIVSIHA